MALSERGSGLFKFGGAIGGPNAAGAAGGAGGAGLESVGVFVGFVWDSQEAFTGALDDFPFIYGAGVECGVGDFVRVAGMDAADLSQFLRSRFDWCIGHNFQPSGCHLHGGILVKVGKNVAPPPESQLY